MNIQGELRVVKNKNFSNVDFAESVRNFDKSCGVLSIGLKGDENLEGI